MKADVMRSQRVSARTEEECNRAIYSNCCCLKKTFLHPLLLQPPTLLFFLPKMRKIALQMSFLSPPASPVIISSSFCPVVGPSHCSDPLSRGCIIHLSSTARLHTSHDLSRGRKGGWRDGGEREQGANERKRRFVQSISSRICLRLCRLMEVLQSVYLCFGLLATKTE